MLERFKRDVAALALPEGRMVGTAGHEKARRRLVDRMTELGLEPYKDGTLELKYRANGVDFTNLLGVIPGQNPGLAPVLIAAHYDTAGPFPGADDNAAAVAILLSLGAQLRAKRLQRSVILASFDAEEPPFFLSPDMGSIHFYHHQRTGPIHCAVVMDLVGHDVAIPSLEKLLFLTGIESDPALAPLLESLGAPPGLLLVPTLNRYVGDMSDHHVFRVQRRPYLFLSCGRWAHYHSPTDTPEKLSYTKMAAIGAFLLGLVENVAATPLEGPFEGADTTSTELLFLRRTFGPLLQALGLPLESRQDIDRAAAVLMSQFAL